MKGSTTLLHYAMNNSLKHANSESVNNFSVGTAEAPHKNSEYFLKDNGTMAFCWHCYKISEMYSNENCKLSKLLAVMSNSVKMKCESCEISSQKFLLVNKDSNPK